MKKIPQFDDTVIINKAIKYTLFGSEYETYAGQKAIVNDDYDEENDELYVALLDHDGDVITYISISLDYIY